MSDETQPAEEPAPKVHKTNKKFLFDNREFYIDGYLAAQLDTVIYNIKDDWDFVILISGDRMVRVGKSVLAMTICAYISSGLLRRKMIPSINYALEDIHFDNKEMIVKAQEKPKFSINHYDEGREGLAANKALQQMQKDLIDFFNECGQLNHFFVIVLPDFFDLKEEIAVGRSECLINVYRRSEEKMVDIYNEGAERPVVKFTRGFFEFFNRTKKASLYDKSRSYRRKSYALVEHNFNGRFTNQWPIDEEAYRAKKRDALARFKERHEEKKQDGRTKTDLIRDRIILNYSEKGNKAPAIQKLLLDEWDYQLGTTHINLILRKYRGVGQL